MTQKPRYGDFTELNPIVFPGKAYPGTPPCLGNRSVFILDPRLPDVYDLLQERVKKHPTTFFWKKKTVRRSKYRLEISKARERLKMSPFEKDFRSLLLTYERFKEVLFFSFFSIKILRLLLTGSPETGFR